MNRVKNMGVSSRIQSRELTDARLQAAAFRAKAEALAATVAQVERKAREATEAMERMREAYSGIVVPHRSGYEITYTIKVKPRRWTVRADGNPASFDTQYQTAMIAIKQSVTRALDLIRDVCPSLDSEALMDVASLEILDEAQ